MAQNLTALTELTRNLIFEDAIDTGLVTPARLAALIQYAHREIYRKIARVAASELSVVSADLTTAADGTVNLLTSYPAGVIKIAAVELKRADGSFEPLRFVERSDLCGFEATASGGQPKLWARTGATVMVLPIGVATIRAVLTPGPPDISDSVLPFNGLFPEHDDIVALRAADLAKTKDEKASVWHANYVDALNDLMGEVRRTPLRVKRAPVDPEDS
jgi:hypothetical protein